MDSTRFSGRTALITGGTNGFGRATAELLIAGGARVLVTGRTATSIEETRATLGQRAVVVRSDAASLSDTVALADRARAELGELDLLFVNAGIARSASLAETDEAVYDEVFATNTRGVRHQHQRCLLHRAGTRSAHRRRRRRGDVDVGGERQGPAADERLRGQQGRAALDGADLRPRVAATRVRVNAISPGPIDTGVLERSLPAEVVERSRAQMVANNPMARFGRNEEVARAVAFLAFDATYTTGAELPVDGGVSQLL